LNKLSKKQTSFVTTRPVVPTVDADATTTFETEQDTSFMNFIAGAASSDFPAERASKNEESRTWSRESISAPQDPLEAADRAMQRLVAKLDEAVGDAQSAFTQRRAVAVAEAARRVAVESDNHGLRVLARMARCVERAGRANDMIALKDLLPELTAAVERNRISLAPRA
jgi:hypothetical protein